MTDDTTAHTARASRRRWGAAFGADGRNRREEPVGQGAGEGAWSSGLASLSVSAIEPDPGQPRRHFDEAALDELAASIAARG
jgi:ParB family chromosome partitioning protein